LADTIEQLPTTTGVMPMSSTDKENSSKAAPTKVSSTDTKKFTSRMVNITKSLLGQSIILTGQKTPNR
jgi:hypothetical protein